MDPVSQASQSPANKKVFIGIGVAAAIVAVLGILLVARQTNIPSKKNTTNNIQTVVTPTLLPTIPQTMDDRIKVLEDTVVGIDQSLREPVVPETQP